MGGWSEKLNKRVTSASARAWAELGNMISHHPKAIHDLNIYKYLKVGFQTINPNIWLSSIFNNSKIGTAQPHLVF